MAGRQSISNTFVVTTVEDAQYIYLKGTARDVDSEESTTIQCEVSVTGGSNLATSYRGLNLVTLNKQTLEMVEHINYDTWAQARYPDDPTKTGVTSLIAKLSDITNGVAPYDTNDVFVCLVSFDAIGWNSSLITTLQGFGMDDLPYTAIGRYPFLFFGYKNLGKGNGLTRMHNEGAYDNVAELSTYVAEGAMTMKDGAKGDTGKTGKAYYYAGDWSNTSTAFTCNDYETPFFQYSTDSTKKYWVYVGQEGTISMSAMGTPSSQNANFALMVTDFKFLIAEAIFTDFARLGKWYFNGDYQFSEYGVDANGEEAHYDANHIFYGHDDPDNTYTPNTYMDAKTGQIYTQSITLQGVLNNLINKLVVPTDGVVGNLSKYGCYDSLNKILYLNPLKCGQYISFDDNAQGITIKLPCYYRNSSLPEKEIYGSSVSHYFSLNELRQMVGKDIMFMPMGMGMTAPKIKGDAVYRTKLVTPPSGSPATFDLIDVGTQSSLNTAKSYTKISSEDGISFHQSDSFFLYCHCRTGIYDGCECIYWEVEVMKAVMSRPLPLYILLYNDIIDELSDSFFQNATQKVVSADNEYRTTIDVDDIGGEYLYVAVPSSYRLLLASDWSADDCGVGIQGNSYTYQGVTYNLYLTDSPLQQGSRTMSMYFTPV